MDKYFIFISSSHMDILEIERLAYGHEDIYLPHKEEEGVIVMRGPVEMERKIAKYLSTLKSTRMSVLSSPYSDHFMFELGKNHIAYFPNQLIHPTDLIFKRLSFADVSFFVEFKNYFESVDPIALEAAGTYLRCGCNALVAADTLYVHRNTFNYRLNAFIRESGLDIRDYHNALLLEVYFQLSP
ncbi:MAG: helix-turn-helix domain-containing protein, partial [Bacilli bacterium]|nr:helix-turn-helix domain-containing protein [Bacilli bacterium]